MIHVVMYRFVLSFFALFTKVQAYDVAHTYCLRGKTLLVLFWTDITNGPHPRYFKFEDIAQNSPTGLYQLRPVFFFALIVLTV